MFFSSNSEEQKTLNDAVQKAMDWLDQNQNAEKDDYTAKLKQLEEVCHPIMMKMYPGANATGAEAGTAAAGMPGAGTGSAFGGNEGRGPSIEEVD